MEYQVKIDVFEGPFDLLLFLIQKDEIDIYDIPIAKITTQFIEYVDKAERINLEYAGEFIDMIATLMKIKTVMLLPSKQQQNEEQIEDPRTPLVIRLIEYKKFKEAALNLQELEAEHEFVKRRSYFNFLKEFHQEFEEETSKELIDISLYDLIKAYKKVMDELPKITEHQVKKITISIEEASKRIRQNLFKNKIIYFSEIMKNAEDKIVIVVSFMSILDMVKSQEIDVLQDKLFDDICIKNKAG